MNGDKKRSSKRRSLENGRDLLARYKASQQNMDKHLGEPSDDELDHDSQSLDQQSINMAEDSSFRDTTQSSVSVSEGEGDGDVECLVGRVSELKEVLHGREAEYQQLKTEFENVKDEPGSPSSSHSQNSSTQYRDIVHNYKNYKKKVEDFDREIIQRDLLIAKFKKSLEEAIADRDTLRMELSALRAVYVLPQDISGPIDIKNRICDLEQALSSHVEMVKKLTSQLEKSQDYIKTLEDKNNNHDEQVEEYKNVILQLNEQIRAVDADYDKYKSETEEKERQYQEYVSKIQIDMQAIVDKCSNDTKYNAQQHEKVMQVLEAKYEAEIMKLKQTYEDQYKALFERYNSELPGLESKHAKELQVFQSQLISYKKTIETLELELDNQKKSNNSLTVELNNIKRQLIQSYEDKDMMKEQIQLHKVQIDELTAKYVAASSVLNSRESIERSLEEALLNVEALKRENDELKCRYDDISAKFSAAQALIENNQMHERSMNHKTGEIDKSLSRFSGMSINSEFNTTSYATLDDTAIQNQIFHQRLNDKELMEKKMINRINDLEEMVKKMNKELEEANIEKNSYEKELKETKNKSEKMMSEIKVLKESKTSEPKPFQSNVYFSPDKSDKITLREFLPRQDVNDYKKMDSVDRQIEILKQIIQQKDSQFSEINNKLKNALEKIEDYKSECESLQSGLKNAWQECATAVEIKLDQTFGINDDSKYDESILRLSSNNTGLIAMLGIADKSVSGNKKLANITDKYAERNSHMSELYESSLAMLGKKLDYFHEHMENLEIENKRLNEENEKLLAMKDEFDNIRNEMEKRYATEVEELRTYFEEKCRQMEKQYSEEIFSQQSKKMSDDSEIDEMADDLYFGSGGGDFSDHRDVHSHSKDEEDKADSLDDFHRSKTLEDINRNSVMTVNQLCQTEWDTAVENGELIELRAAYSHQLEEQIALAKRDIVNALQEQIQTLIAAEEDTDNHWPPELIELRNKFTNNAKREIEKLKEIHSVEISQLKEEHKRTIAKTIDAYKEKINKVMLDGENNRMMDASVGEKDVIKQRDNWYQTCVILKGLINELVRYFASCEEELNNTLITEVLKRQLDNNQDLSTIEEIEENIQFINNKNTSLLSSPITSPKMKIKRVHFAPQPSQISTILKNNTDILYDIIEDKHDITEELRIELEKCLQRLKNESAQLFGLTLSPGESIVDAISKQITGTSKVNDDLTLKLLEAENTIQQYEDESRELKLKIMELQQKLIAMDSSREIISEGYGEQDTEAELVIQDFSQLHERARMAIMSGAGDNTYLLQLIEELCRYHDNRTEEIKKEKEDLQQQVSLDTPPSLRIERVRYQKIEAADKQLRATRKFLEEQASEREVERDDAARQIQALKDQLKERDREKERDLRITSEQHSLSPETPVIATPTLLQVSNQEADVDALVLQIREQSSLISDLEVKKSHHESELKSAIDKVWELREIIKSLENQIELKAKREEVLTDQIERMNDMIMSQSNQNQELMAELESHNMSVDGEINIAHLQEELRRHKLSTEHFNVNSSALKQMKSELQDMLNHLDRRTKELETLHMCGSNLSISQPSEDVSIRDQIDAARCPTPDDPNGPPTLPLDQLLKLKEKLLKHTRAEEVAFKRIKDLDMQLSTMKMQYEELQAEQEILQQHNSEQLFQIETMRGRLEQQKQSAPFAQRQATSKLESQLHEVNAKLLTLEQTLANKDIMLKEVNSDLDRTRQLLREKQEELAAVVQGENNIVQDLKDRIDILEHENQAVKVKLNSHERKTHELPQIFDSVLADKNEEIDHLKDQLSKKDKEIDALRSLHIDDNILGKGSEPKNSARTLSDILSIHSECEEVSEAIREKSMRDASHNMTVPKFPMTLMMCNDHLDGSSMPLTDLQRSPMHVPPLELNSHHNSVTSPQHVSHPQISVIDSIHSEFDLKSPVRRSTTMSDPTGNSPQRPKNSPRSSRSDKITPNRVQSQLADSPRPSIEALENQLKTIHRELQAKSATLNKREMELDSLQKRLDELRAEFKDSMDTLMRDKIFYQTQYELSQESESKIRRDLMEVENDLKIKMEELDVYKEKIQSNESILHRVQTDNSALAKDIKRLRDENCTYQITICEKTEELNNLKKIVFEKDITIETFKTRSEEIENENKQLYEYKTKYETCKRELIDCQNEVERVVDGLNKRDELIKKLEETVRRTSGSLSCNNCSASDKGQLIIHQEELMKQKDKEIHHLQEYIKEKDKVIKHMSDDSRSLQRSLETIQSKMKETGNVVELRRKLKEERMLNDELTKMVGKLKRELKTLRDESLQQEAEGIDIEDMVKRELNLSADLDKKIFDAIDNDCEMVDTKTTDSRRLLMPNPVENDIDSIMQQYTDIKRRLKTANKLNEKLNSEKTSLEIHQDILRSQIAEYENRILQIKADYDTELKKNVALSRELVNQKAVTHKFEHLTTEQQRKFNIAQQESTDIIKTLRIRLTSSLESESGIKNELAAVRQQNKILKAQLLTLQESISPEQAKILSASPVLKENDQEHLLLKQKYETTLREMTDLKDTLIAVENDKSRAQHQLKSEISEREKILNKLVALEEANDNMDIELKRRREELKGYKQDCEWLQQKIQIMTENEKKIQAQELTDQMKIKSLNQEIRDIKDVLQDLETDHDELKRQLVISQSEQNRLAQAGRSLRKMEMDLQKKVAQSKKEEEKLKDIISDMQVELTTHCNRELELSKGLLVEISKDQAHDNVKLVEKIAELSSEIARYSNEKGILYDKLIKAREEAEKNIMRVRELETLLTQSESNESDHEVVAKLQELYVKYLRVDSKRKALAFQKRYLVCVIGGYQMSHGNHNDTVSELAKLTNNERSYVTEQILDTVTKCPKTRFRTAARAIVAISRIKWMVSRWKSRRKTTTISSNINARTIQSSLTRDKRRQDNCNNNNDSPHTINFDHYAQRFFNINKTLGLAMSDTDAKTMPFK